MSASYIYFIIFFCIGYLIVTDQSVAKAFYMLTQLARVQYEKTKWRILHNPANPIVKYLMWRRSIKIAEELMEELAQKDKN
jgi:hypothetical protein